MSGPILTHRVSGAGPGAPVLLLNGGLMTIGGWGAVADGLAESRRVISFDFRGQLQSPGDPPPALDGHVADVVALLDHLDVAETHAVGTSFGAFVAVLLAARHPDRVRSLGLVTATDRITPEMWAGARPLLDSTRTAADGGDGAAVLDSLLPTTFSPGYLASQAQALDERRRQFRALPRAWFAGLHALLASLEGLDLTPALGRVRCPALVVAAAEDRMFPVAGSEALAAGIPGARLAVVDGSGHALVAEAPDRLLGLVRPFLAAST